jgi:DHA1 family bicyclomycin/chloramphenicol resistance-like MFS transporter
MTATDVAAAKPGGERLRPGSGLFIFVLAMGMAVTALGVDTVLPAFPDIRESLGLEAGSTKVAGLITFFLMGSSAGLLPAGLLADRFGRRPVMWGGLVLYVVGAIAAAFAPSLAVMFVARFVWGLGSAGPRVAVMAMVRDSYEGEQMAKQMSFIMAVFILVPTFAPALAAGLLLIGPWQIVFWLCAAAGVAMLLATMRLPETLHPADRTVLSAREVWVSCRTVLATPGTAGYLVSLTALFGVFLSYLASSEIILDQVFGLSDWFPLFFGGLSLAMGFGMFVNGRVVERVGLDRLVGRVFTGSVVAVAGLLAVALATGGEPNFWVFVVQIGAVLFLHQMLIPDLNAAAMRPLAHVAGTGSAILGMVPGVLGSLIGWAIDRRFDGTILPLSIAYAVATVTAIVGWRWAVRATSAAALPLAPTPVE